jgi:hypothetical protein
VVFKLPIVASIGAVTTRRARPRRRRRFGRNQAARAFSPRLDDSCFAHSGRSEGVVRGGVEPPTFRFSENIAIRVRLRHDAARRRSLGGSQARWPVWRASQARPEFRPRDAITGTRWGSIRPSAPGIVHRSAPGRSQRSATWRTSPPPGCTGTTPAVSCTASAEGPRPKPKRTTTLTQPTATRLPYTHNEVRTKRGTLQLRGRHR